MVSNRKIFIAVNVDWFFLSHRLYLATELKNLGNDVYILTRDTGYKDEILKHNLKFIDIPFDRSGTNFIYELKLLYTIFQTYRLHQPDLIHHVTIKPSIYGSLILRLIKKRIKIVNAISGLGYNFIEDRYTILQRILLKMMDFAFKQKSINFIFQNPDDLAFYKSRNYINSNNHTIIKGSGVDQNIFNYVKPVLKTKIHVLFSGRLLKDKGVVEFVKAANELHHKYSDKVEFVLMGDIDDHNKASITQNELSNYTKSGVVNWIGFKKDVMSELILSDIVCLPSYGEGLPKSLIEAMAIGRPIVTTDTPGCRECVIEGSNGFLVPVKSVSELVNKLEMLIGDEVLRLNMGRESRSIMISEFSLDAVMMNTVKFYKKILDE